MYPWKLMKHQNQVIHILTWSRVRCHGLLLNAPTNYLAHKVLRWLVGGGGGEGGQCSNGISCCHCCFTHCRLKTIYLYIQPNTNYTYMYIHDFLFINFYNHEYLSRSILSDLQLQSTQWSMVSNILPMAISFI